MHRQAAVAALGLLALGALPAVPAVAAADVCVGLVVDYGTRNDAPATEPRSGCVELPDRSTADEVLGRRARYGSGGLVCAIDGYPAAPECGTRTDDGDYAYWSYWYLRDGRWHYSNTGPASRRVTEGSVEGWRFQVATGGPNDPPPRAAPDFYRLCPQRSPAPSPTRPPNTAFPRPAATATAAPTAAATRTPTRPPTPRSTPLVSSAPPSTPPAATPSEATTDDTLPLAEPAAADGGRPWGALGGLALLVGLGAAAAVRFRRPAS